MPDLFTPTYNNSLPLPGAGSNSSLYNPGPFTAGGFAYGSNLTNGFGTGSAGGPTAVGGYQPTIGGSGGGGSPFSSAPSRPGAQRIGNYTFYHPDRPLNWTEYGPKAPSWPVIRNSMPYSVESPFTRGRATPAVAGLETVPTAAAFDGAGFDSTTAFINSLVAQIQGQPQTLGWFESGTRPAQLFGVAY